MAAIEDIRIPLDFWDHRKTRKLIRRLGLEGAVALQRLWMYAARRRQDGFLHHMTHEDIALEAKWEGEPDAFVQALLTHGNDHGFIDVVDGVYYLHEWHEHQKWVVGAPERSEIARQGGLAKARGRSPKATNLAPSSTGGTTHEQTGSSAGSVTPLPSSPLLSSPNPPLPFPGAGAPAHEGDDETSLFSESKGLEGWHELLKHYMAISGKPMLSPLHQQQLRDGVMNLQITGHDAVALLEAKARDQRAKGRQPWKFGHPNFVITILAEAVAERAAGSAAAGKKQVARDDAKKRYEGYL